MSLEQFADYLSFYDNCVEYCAEDLECVNDIITEYPNFCKKNDEIAVCKIVTTKKYKNLLILLAKIVKLMYTLRGLYGNTYDMNFIVIVGYLPLDYEEYNCVVFDTYSAGMPNNLGDYFAIMHEMAKPQGNRNSDLMKKFRSFVSDFQPWTTILVDFLNSKASHILQELFGFSNFPSITNIQDYGSIATDKKYINLINSQKSLYNPNYYGILKILYKTSSKSRRKISFRTRKRITINKYSKK
jgi:hypothetical protein